MGTRNVRAALTLLAIAGVASGCAAPSSRDSAPVNQGVQELKITPVFQTFSGGTVRKRSLPRRFIFLFGANPGLFGSESFYSRFGLETFTGTSESFSLTLDEWASTAWAIAEPLPDNLVASGPDVSPRATRFASAWAMVVNDAHAGMRVGQRHVLRDDQGRRLYLIYVDRPCRLQGVWKDFTRRSILSQSVDASLDVQIDAPGFHLLVLEPGSDEQQVLLRRSDAQLIQLASLFERAP